MKCAHRCEDNVFVLSYLDSMGAQPDEKSNQYQMASTVMHLVATTYFATFLTDEVNTVDSRSISLTLDKVRFFGA